MNELHSATNTFRTRLIGLADWLFRCSHRRTTFPRTLRAGLTEDGQEIAPAETYVACLECGRRLAYDWKTMRITSKVPDQALADVLVRATA